VLVHIERFGAKRDSVASEVARFLAPDMATVFERNLVCVDQDPMTVAAVAALVHLRDKFVWGILPATCLPEVMRNYAAEVAAAVSGKYERLAEYRERLAREPLGLDNEVFLALIFRSLALGFAEKWE